MSNQLIYPFGFLLTKKKFKNQHNWKMQRVNRKWKLYYSKNNEFIKDTYGKTKMMIIGYFFDIRNGNKKPHEIISALLTARQHSYKNFLEEFSYISGRYLLILSHDKKINIYHDICGLRAVFYHENKGIIGSHDSLINEVMGNKLEQIYESPDEISFSCNSRFKHVIKLIPNMTLEINTGNIERYYPLQEFSPKTKEEIKKELKYYFEQTVTWLKSSTYKPLLSLTGGGDSRMSLAILKPIVNELELFTYLRDTTGESNFVRKTFANDEKIVNSIVNNLNLNHKFLYISNEEDIDPKVQNALMKNTFSHHSRSLAYDYYKIFGNQNYMHIRSTALFNIGKYIFPEESLDIDIWDIGKIAKFVKKWTNIDNDEQNEKYVAELLDYAQLNNYYNYNPLELLFISYRLIQWHSGVVTESDIGFNTMLLLNSRKIVDLMLSYPIEDRYENKLFYELIEDLWPILNYWEVNTKHNLKDKLRVANNNLSKLQNQLKDVSIFNKNLLSNFMSTSSSQAKELNYSYINNGIEFKFSNKDIEENDYYEINIDLDVFRKSNNPQLSIEFFYNNKKGRGNIVVTSNLFEESRDILELYGKHKILINELSGQIDKLYVKIQHNQPTNSSSWANASRIWIGDITF